MEKKGKRKTIKLSWPIWAVVVLGLIIFALPIPVNYKYWLAIPLYALFLFVYYRAKKSSS
jgi:hypothetical protein